MVEPTRNNVIINKRLAINTIKLLAVAGIIC